MGAAARHNLSRRVADENFVHHVFTIAFDVTVDDDGAGGEPFADSYGREQFPFLARVQVAENVRQIPSERAVHRVVENQRGSEGAAERRVAAIPRIVVTGARDVLGDEFGRDVPGDAAEVASDVNLFAIENLILLVSHRDALRFLFDLDSFVELGRIDDRPPVAPGANLLDVVEGAYSKLEPPAFDLGHFRLRASAMPRRRRCGVADLDRHADRTFAGVEKRLDRFDCRLLHHCDHRGSRQNCCQRRVEMAGEIGGSNRLRVSAFCTDWNWFHGYSTAVRIWTESVMQIAIPMA